VVRIAIVEDDDFYVKQLVEYLERYEQENGIEIETDIFTDGAMVSVKLCSQFPSGFEMV
jgi:hypothetical protein